MHIHICVYNYSSSFVDMHLSFAHIVNGRVCVIAHMCMCVRADEHMCVCAICMRYSEINRE